MAHQRGTSNTLTRGNVADRRKRRAWLLSAESGYGDGTHARCVTCPAVLDDATITVDRITPGVFGGSYWVKRNIQPQCAPCSRLQGATLRQEIREANHMPDVKISPTMETDLRQIGRLSGWVANNRRELKLVGLTVASLTRLANKGLVKLKGERWTITTYGYTWLRGRDTEIAAAAMKARPFDVS